MKIAFLINNAFGIGGTIRSTANLSAAFADRHDVEVVSVHRSRAEPALTFDPRVRLTSLIDLREGTAGYEGDHPLTERPGTMFPYSGATGNLPYTGLQDARIGGFLAHTEADVVIATRPDLNGYLARDGRHRYLRVGQEHLSLDQYREPLRTDQTRAIAGLDAYVTVSEADAAQYRAALPDVGTTIVCVPNGVRAGAVERSTLDSRVIVAAGRLIPIKRYDRLVNAFAKVAADHPGWTLRIYGRGPQKENLREQIDRLGLHDRVFLMGAVSPIETEWAKGAVAAVSSDMESFGMTIVEAMHCGVPVVATDCPHGPGEIITDGRDGILVPLDGDVDAYADALNRVVGDETLRERLGKEALTKAETYAPAAVARRYEDLFEELTGARSRRRDGAARLGRLAVRAARAVRSRRVRDTPADGTGGSAATPSAHARATGDGGLVVRLDPAELPAGPLDFVARLRRDPGERQIGVPVLPSADAPDTVVQAVLRPTEHTLAEGRWDCYVVPRGTTKRLRLTARLVEQAALVGRPPSAGRDGVGAWIPYPTADGFLALRTWLRPAHAEIDTVEVGEESVTVTATLYGDADAVREGAEVRAVSRTDTAYDFTVVARAVGERVVRFTVPYGEIMARRAVEHDLWDLRVAGVPVGRIGGDVVERRKTDLVPGRVFPHAERGRTRVRPYFTVRNELALSARDAGEGA
ncbi:MULTISPECIES: glycosyltransferase family 4 protein [Streptomyces]|uniref:glycosyltransferase family 4 protein n=1 Tax=Streptomyces scabiei TaxID=1930 RepID=UPI001B30205C|nr:MULTISPECIES: glycosyltransferase family 4 protein [Streptomyces]MBP5867798.1 glycosyltransferase family 4 protein [Streptomyces sp. LBUM 1485]MBP5893170.1 glycosyltransferase family 4 protein [Streptomyces sp. LBUM 1481]MBP5923419.1 glycosyltransferase family 4 protein [Streptomyces sp. LBUM 1483]MDX2688913.1 glycosyltransferase family 4 protein [Streptomyces scabiei]MDX2753849.1 glycosyltransferase family 4 protein [Streptomyces scabiei]